MKRIAKLVTLALACVLMVGVIVGMTVSAANTDNTGLSIKGKNVAYNAATQLCVAVNGVNDANKNSVAMLFWDYNPGSNPTAESATSKQIGADELEDVYYFLSYGVDAKDMSAKIYFAPALVENGEITDIGTVSAGYSIVDYAIQRLLEQDGSAAQANLYQKLLVYAGAAETMFGNKEIDFALISAENGYVGKYDANVIGAYEGDTVLLRAEANNADGEYFLYWEKDGVRYSDKRVTETAPAENGKSVYTAVYGEKKSSAYANAFVFESSRKSKLDDNNNVVFDFPELTYTYNDANWIYYGTKTTTQNALLPDSSFDLKLSKVEWGAPLTEIKEDTVVPEGAHKVDYNNKKWYYLDSDKVNYVNDPSYIHISEDKKTGDAELEFTKGAAADNGITAMFWNQNKTNVFEYDVCWETRDPGTETQITVGIRKNSATSGFDKLADLNISIEKDNRIKVSTNIIGGTKTIGDITYTYGGTLGYINYNLGETLTLTFEVRFDKALPELDIYANGQLAIVAGATQTNATTVKHPLAGFAGVHTYNSEEEYFLRMVQHFQLRSVKQTQIIDNPTFLVEAPYADDILYTFETGYNNLVSSNSTDKVNVITDPNNVSNKVLSVSTTRAIDTTPTGGRVNIMLDKAKNTRFAISYSMMIPSQDNDGDGIFNEYYGDMFSQIDNDDIQQMMLINNGDYFAFLTPEIIRTGASDSTAIANGFKFFMADVTSGSKVTKPFAGTYNLDTWYSITLVVDTENKTIDLFVDGTYVDTYRGGFRAASKDYTGVDFTTDVGFAISNLMRTKGTVLYDDIALIQDASAFVVPEAE